MEASDRRLSGTLLLPPSQFLCVSLCLSLYLFFVPVEFFSLCVSVSLSLCELIYAFVAPFLFLLFSLLLFNPLFPSSCLSLSLIIFSNQ